MTYPEAIYERVVTKRNLEQNSIELRVGRRSPPISSQSSCHTPWLLKVSILAQAGEFSVRGGIVDIYLLLTNRFYRVERLR